MPISCQFGYTARTRTKRSLLMICQKKFCFVFIVIFLENRWSSLVTSLCAQVARKNNNKATVSQESNSYNLPSTWNCLLLAVFPLKYRSNTVGSSPMFSLQQENKLSRCPYSFISAFAKFWKHSCFLWSTTEKITNVQLLYSCRVFHWSAWTPDASKYQSIVAMPWC